MLKAGDVVYIPSRDKIGVVWVAGLYGARIDFGFNIVAFDDVDIVKIGEL